MGLLEFLLLTSLLGIVLAIVVSQMVEDWGYIKTPGHTYVWTHRRPTGVEMLGRALVATPITVAGWMIGKSILREIWRRR
jgi:hypothetical protein